MGYRNDFAQYSPLRWLIIHYLFFCIHLMPAVLSRVLPTSLNGPHWSMTRSVASLPTPLSNVPPESEAIWHKNTRRFKCIVDTFGDESDGFNCTMLSHDSLFRKRSLGVSSSDPLGKSSTPTSQILPWGATLHPCWFEVESQPAKLMCEKLSQNPDEAQEDIGLEALIINLTHGLPISFDPELNLPSKLDPEIHRYVSIYPNGSGYDILLMDSPHKRWPLELFLSTDDVSKPPKDSPLPVLQTGADSSSHYHSLVPGPEKGTHTTFGSQPHQNLACRQLQGSCERTSHVRCWFHPNEQTLTIELNCAIDETASWRMTDLLESDFAGNLDSNETCLDPDLCDTNLGDGQPENTTKSRKTRDDHPTESEDSKQLSPPDILVDRWFLCWTGTGLKMLCEVPDWYGIDDYHPQSIHVRRASLPLHKSNTNLPQSKLSSLYVPLHFLVDPLPIWRYCELSYEPSNYGMECLNLGTSQAAIRPGRALKSGPINQDLRQRDPAPAYHSREKRDEILSDQSAQNMTPVTTTKPKISAFGRMGEIFAYIGFFSVVAAFTIVLSWLVKHLFLAIYDGLEEWTDNRRRKRKLNSTKDFGADNELDDRAPSYVANDGIFQEQVFTVAFPQAARIGEEDSAAISTTGSQAVEGSNDSIKRKKAAMRAGVAEGNDTELE